MATVDEQLQALVSRVAALETANAGLHANLDATRGGLDLTMRGQGRCRACGGGAILHAAKIVDRSNHGYPAPMSVRLRGWMSKPAGTFEAYICAGCGLVEWYVKDPAAAIGDDVKPVAPRGAGEGSPYR